ncbi:MAG TPA: hypothetical protein VGM76_13035 [Lacipirellulaceae bacterium]
MARADTAGRNEPPLRHEFRLPMQNSGKLLIIAMFVVALAAASASWWFRYAATHRAAQFWGPEAARLIRDAPIVELLSLQSTPWQVLRSSASISDHEQAASKSSSVIEEIRLGNATLKITARGDISNAPGITHLRSALLEDRSFDWGPFVSDHDEQWTTAILFRESDESQPLTILFLPNFTRALVYRPDSDGSELIGTQPIAAGLAETINEWSQLPAAGDRPE